MTAAKTISLAAPVAKVAPVAAEVLEPFPFWVTSSGLEVAAPDHSTHLAEIPAEADTVIVIVTADPATFAAYQISSCVELWVPETACDHVFVPSLTDDTETEPLPTATPIPRIRREPAVGVIAKVSVVLADVLSAPTD